MLQDGLETVSSFSVSATDTENRSQKAKVGFKTVASILMKHLNEKLLISGNTASTVNLIHTFIHNIIT